MAKFNEVLGVLRSYRNELENQMHEESVHMMESFGFRSFKGRGASSAFSTPLTNVHATGVGLRVRKGKIVDDEFVIKVYVFDKKSLGKKTPELTKKYHGVDIDVEAMPVQLALAKAQRRRKPTIPAAFATTSIAEHRMKLRPVAGGITIAPLNQSFVGTLGCFLQRTTGGTTQTFVLSNNHVLADCDRLPVGTSIVQPGAEVTPSTPADVFAALNGVIPIQFPASRDHPVVNLFDAAIALVADETLIQKTMILGIDTFTPKVGVPVPGMQVIKSGRTTGVTRGKITGTAINGVQVNYGSAAAPRIASFNDTIRIVSNDAKPFSMPGDSGSVIIDASTGQPVALLFAGDGIGTTACDLSGICKQFKAFPV